MQSAEEMARDDANTSMEHILTNELYAKKAMTLDDETLQVPFPVLPGESVLFLGKTDGGVIALSDFRLFIRFKESFINIPLGLIESVEYRDVFYINIYCKDAHSLRCTLLTNESCLEWYKRLTAVLQPHKKLADVFAFAFRAWCLDTGCLQDGTKVEHGMAHQLCNTVDIEGGYSFGREVERMGFDLKTTWKISYVNENYKVCGSYPKEHLIPVCRKDKDGKELDLKSVVNFRASHRFPTVVWRNQANGAVIARSSQPEVGWLGWRNEHDERLLQAISAACALGSITPKHPVEPFNDLTADAPDSGPKKMLIIDARSYTAAWANRAKGGGCECPEYYSNCEIQFMSLANIHTVRKSFHAVRALCALGTEQPNWLTSVENTKWLSHISLLMRSALLVVNAIDREARPVLVHCSDGWDRTPQIVALAELMLDPFHRTISGFRILVEREWLAFGHKFADRCGNGLGSDDINERCPVFLQWLDCVHQLLLQFPCAFQFNEAFLVKLVHHVYSGLFGTFLCNTIAEREDGKVLKQTNSLWSLLVQSNKKFVNLLYKADVEMVLRPSCHMRRLHLWQAVYLSETAPTAVVDPLDNTDDGMQGTEDPGQEQTLLPKTRSCEDIAMTTDHAEQNPALIKTRRLSDPHITTDPNSLLQSTESLDVNVEKSVENENIGGTVYKDLPITTGINDVVPSEDDGIITDKLDHAVTAHTDGDSAQAHNGCVESENIDLLHKKDDECDTSEYGIALIDSPQAISSPDIAELDLRENGLLDHASSSTDTLTGEGQEWNLNKRSCDAGIPLVHKQIAPPSQHHNAIVTADKNSSSTIQNGHRLMANGQNLTISSKAPRNHGHKGNNHTGHNGQIANETNSPFRLEDILSKLDIECLLEGGSLGRDGVESNRLTRCSSKESRENSSCREETGDHGSISSYHCRTPGCSTGPPTPGADMKASSWFSRHQSSLGRHLDCDGLTTFNDPVQGRLAEMKADYEHKIQELKHQLYVAKAVIYQCAAGRNGTGKQMDAIDDLLSTESADSGEHGSLEGGSLAASDLSWEEIEERDAHMTLWVPDHAVTHCAGCDEMFWVVRRKHHCRNCGRVFCGECTKYYKPLPDQHLPNPQRVCMDCFHSVSEGLTTMVDNDIMLEIDTKSDNTIASS